MLSTRGAKWATIDYAHGKKDRYDPVNNLDGVVDMGNAENWLMHDALTEFINKTNVFSKHCCAYGEGYTGTLRLRTAMATHLNEFFDPATEIDAEEITFAAGVTDLNEVCALLTCNEGEAIMLVKPVYGTFLRDLATRAGVQLEYVSTADDDQFGLACVTAVETGLNAAHQRGVTVKALVICNLHNPLGRCYPRETLIALLRLCNSWKIHLISDEIYALSTYTRDDRPSEKFTSVRSIDFTDIIDPRQVHVLYGMSKDYGAGGLRLGCVVSQNKEFVDATRAICRFSSPSQFSMEIAAKMLEDREFIRGFLSKSHTALRDSRMLAERLLDQNGIDYYKPGNAGLFIWLDLSPFLPIDDAGGDGWEAERLLNRRLKHGKGIVMSTGEAYGEQTPGNFRLVHCVEEAVLREGIKRIARVISKHHMNSEPGVNH